MKKILFFLFVISSFVLQAQTGRYAAASIFGDGLPAYTPSKSKKDAYNYLDNLTGIEWHYVGSATWEASTTQIRQDPAPATRTVTGGYTYSYKKCFWVTSDGAMYKVADDGLAWEGLTTSGGGGAVTSVNGSTGAVTVQPTLVSGTNIKTVNGTTLLGSGDLTVQGVQFYDAGNGAFVAATGTGVTFTRTNAAVWNLNAPAGVRILSFKIYSTAGQFFGSNVTINYNYTSNTLTNQGFSTANPPTCVLWDMQAGSYTQFVTGGAQTSAFRPLITSCSGGNISMQYTTPAGLTSGETLITGMF